MSGVRKRWPAALAVFASLLGFTFASLSSLDYIQHLDRQVHDVHCSYIPSLGAEPSPDNACRVAMYSPYAALFRDRFWGGVPIALFALGAFTFFAAFAVYLFLAGRRASRKALIFQAAFGATPLVISIVMAVISAVKLGHFCKTCVGIYVSSALLAIAGVAALIQDHEPWGAWTGQSNPPRHALDVPPTLPGGGAERTLIDDEPPVRPEGGFLLVPVWAFALCAFACVPGLIYTSALPKYTSYISSCGKLEKAPDNPSPLIHVAMPAARQPATLVIDPLCPTCKAFHQRLVTEGFLDKLDITLVLFPLDSDCNWMLDRPLHPGSCAVSKAILCNERRALSTLEWAFDNQTEILEAAKAGAGVVNVRAMIKRQFPGLDACIDSKETSLRMNRILRYIVNNHLPVSTPQMFLGETRLCDEDTDMGLSYTLHKLAPGLETR
jgi:uncharacterized membrane protein